MSVSHGASGKVVTGFSQPWVGVYAESSGTISFSSQQELARGVNVTITPDDPSSNDYWANNQMAESVPGRFSSGTMTLTVDGLLIAAEKLLLGLPTAGSDGWISQGDSASAPYVGIGFIIRYMSGNVESFTPFVLPKCKVNPFGPAAATENNGEIDWQSQELTFKVFRADNANHDWRWIGADEATEAAALAAMKTKLGISQ